MSFLENFNVFWFFITKKNEFLEVPYNKARICHKCFVSRNTFVFVFDLSMYKIFHEEQKEYKTLFEKLITHIFSVANLSFSDATDNYCVYW